MQPQQCLPHCRKNDIKVQTCAANMIDISYSNIDDDRIGKKVMSLLTTNSTMSKTNPESKMLAK